MMIDTGDELGMVTDAERKAIQAIKHLGRRWPQTIALLSMNGSLYVVHTDDKRLDGDSTADRGKAVLAQIHGIPNDGGDW